MQTALLRVFVISQPGRANFRRPFWGNDMATHTDLVGNISIIKHATSNTINAKTKMQPMPGWQAEAMPGGQSQSGLAEPMRALGGHAEPLPAFGRVTSVYNLAVVIISFDDMYVFVDPSRTNSL